MSTVRRQASTLRAWFPRVGAGPRSCSVFWLVLAGAVGWPAHLQAVEFATCAEVREFLKSPLPDNAYTRAEVLGKAVDALKRQSAPPSEGCDDWVIERTFFEYADALDKHSQSFVGDAEATQTWALDAAVAYGQHLDWFLGLTESRQNGLMRLLLKAQRVSEDEFIQARRKWLRTRIGNALNSMGSAYVRAQAWDKLLDAYEAYFRQSVEIFPNEVAGKWHKWLRALPDFKAEKRDAQIKSLIADNTDHYSRWEAFKEFLDAFLPANPSVRGQWTGVRQRLSQWLSS